MFAGPVPQPRAGGRVLHRSSSSASASPSRRPRSARVPDCVLPAGAESADADDACSVPITARAGRSARRARRLRAAASASPAVEGRAAPGDTIVAIDGEPVDRTRPTSAGRRCRTPSGSSPDTPVVLTIERDGDAARPDRHADREHRLRRRRQRRRPTTGVGYVGVSPAQTYVQQSVTEVPGLPRRLRRRASVDRLVEIPQRVPALFRAAFLGEERDPQGPIGVVGVGRISGEVFALDRVHHHREDQLLLPAAGRRQPGAVPVQPAADLPAGRRARRRRAVREGPRHRSPGCAAGPTRARSTSPG